MSKLFINAEGNRGENKLVFVKLLFVKKKKKRILFVGSEEVNVSVVGICYANFYLYKSHAYRIFMRLNIITMTKSCLSGQLLALDPLGSKLFLK